MYICLLSSDYDSQRVILAGDSVAPIDPSTAKEKHTTNRNHLKNAVSPSKQVLATYI